MTSIDGSGTMIHRNEPFLIVIGSSGAGKTTLVRHLVEDGVIELTRSYTTRPRRRAETGFADHEFVDELRFARLKANDFFLGTAHFFGLPFEYGLPKIGQSDQNRIPAIVLRAMVVSRLFDFYNNGIVYQIESPEERVAERIASHNDEGVAAMKRLKAVEDERQLGRSLAKRVFVNDGSIDHLVAEVKKALCEDFPSYFVRNNSARK